MICGKVCCVCGCVASNVLCQRACLTLYKTREEEKRTYGRYVKYYTIDQHNVGIVISIIDKHTANIDVIMYELVVQMTCQNTFHVEIHQITC